MTAKNEKNPCQEGGAELLPFLVKVPAAAEVKLKIQLCGSRGRVVAYLDGHALMDQEVAADQAVELTLESLSPGIHALHWSLLVPGKTWEMRSEVEVNGVDRFRQRKGSDSDKPYNHGFLMLEAS